MDRRDATGATRDLSHGKAATNELQGNRRPPPPLRQDRGKPGRQGAKKPEGKRQAILSLFSRLTMGEKHFPGSYMKITRGMNRLLAKYIFNEASPRERERVERWLDGNPRRRQELEELRARIDLAARRYRHGMFDARRALARVLQRRGNTRALVSRVAATAAVIALVAGSWLLLVPSPRATTLVALPGETRASLLPDGSRVTLEGPSSLEYATGFDETREVSVTGTAYFEVTSDPRRPFIVHSALLDVRVLGTTFQVEGDATRAGVLVREGRVLVLPAGEQGGEVLVAGMSAARVAGEDGLTVSPFDLNRLSWKTGEFRFRDAPLSEVAALFNRHFRVAISLPDSLSSLRVTASFDRPTLREALDVINQTLGTTIPAVTLPEK